MSRRAEIGSDPTGRTDKFKKVTSVPVKLDPQGTAESVKVDLGNYSIQGKVELFPPTKEEAIGAESRLTLSLVDKRTRVTTAASQSILVSQPEASLETHRSRLFAMPIDLIRSRSGTRSGGVPEVRVDLFTEAVRPRPVLSAADGVKANAVYAWCGFEVS